MIVTMITAVMMALRPFDGDSDVDIDYDDDPTNDSTIDLPPEGPSPNDVKMEELLCDLLNALGVPMPDDTDEGSFKRTLYDATMAKIKELTQEAQNKPAEPDPTQDLNKEANKPNQSPQNPLIQQEQQPMYMSLDDINAIEDPTMKNIALSMYAENEKLRAEMENANKTTNSLRDAKLAEENKKRQSRVAMLSRLSPKVKDDLESMLSMESMALSMGEGGEVVDPMATTLDVLEKSLAGMPQLFKVGEAALSEEDQPTDGDILSEEEERRALAALGYVESNQQAS